MLIIIVLLLQSGELQKLESGFVSQIVSDPNSAIWLVATKTATQNKVGVRLSGSLGFHSIILPAGKKSISFQTFIKVDYEGGCGIEGPISNVFSVDAKLISLKWTFLA